MLYFCYFYVIIPTETSDQPYSFDCRQMAALVEYYLERSGIRTSIALIGNLTIKNEEIGASSADVPRQNNFTHAFVTVDIHGGLNCTPDGLMGKI